MANRKKSAPGRKKASGAKTVRAPGTEPRGRRASQGGRIFALDIGTRTVVGILGEMNGDQYKIIDCVVAPHTKRAMVDGQIEDIKQVAKVVADVKEQLEKRNRVELKSAAIAAAGRALRTVVTTKDFDVSDREIITPEMIASMEMETIQQAQAQIDEETKGKGVLFYCVGHNVVNYRLDDYKIISLEGHKGKTASVDMVVAFLPSVVVEGLYSVMDLNKLEVRNLTLEPIAAMNVIIPPEIRLINIALVDVGAGTSDIAIAKDGAIVAYAMATTAGDEITEDIIRTFLVDFNTAEQMKHDLDTGEDVAYKDIFGMPHTVKRGELMEKMTPSVDALAATIAETITGVNGSSPQAVFLVGGGSLTKGLSSLLSQKLGIDENHVAVGGSQFLKNVNTGGLSLGAEFITPIGIGVTAALNSGYDFSVITLNDKKLRVFDTKQLSVYELLSLAGYRQTEIMGHSGRNLAYTLNGNRMLIKGGGMIPASITVNGKSASLTARVTQGDSVVLTPAENGFDARQTVADAIGAKKHSGGFITVGDRRLSFGLKAFCGGEEVPLDYDIQPLDDISTGGILTLGDLLYSIEDELADADEILVNGKKEEVTYLLENGDIISLGTSSKAEKSENNAEKPAEAAASEDRAAGISVLLNGKYVELPESAEPHKFLELLTLIDFDPATPKSDIVIELNGVAASFNAPLSDGDKAVIRWKEL